MSVRWMRTGTINQGKFLEAIAWSRETVAQIEKKHGGLKIHTWVDAFGTVGTIRWTMDFPDLATFDKVQTPLLADGDYHRAVGKAAQAQLFADGFVDSIYREL